MNVRKVGVGIVLAGLAAGGIVWALSSRGTDPQVQKVQQLQAELFAEKTPPEQRRQRFEVLRKETEQLSPEQREEVRHQMRQQFERRMQERVDAYFALPPEQRTAHLDQQIDAMEQRRKEWESRRARQGQTQQGQTRQGQPRRDAGARGRGGNRRNMSAEQRSQRRKQRLDRSTPEQRAKRTAYFDALRKRRQERGLPDFPRGRGRWSDARNA